MAGAIRVLLVEDQRILREGLHTILDLEEGIEVVGEAENGRRAVDLAAELHPDVVVMDLKMPVMDGVEATRRIIARCPRSRVVVLTTYDHDNLVLDALRAGARGYLLKDAPADEMIHAIHLAHHGESWLQPGIAAKLLAALQDGEAQIHSPAATGTGVDATRREEHPPAPVGISIVDSQDQEMAGAESLTERELQVLTLVAAGASNLRIAQQLHLAEGTVKNHISVIMDKLGASNRTQAVALARRRGFLS
jgi:DNA-binding NarL/FixJ family response regulator